MMKLQKTWIYVTYKGLEGIRRLIYFVAGLQRPIFQEHFTKESQNAPKMDDRRNNELNSHKKRLGFHKGRFGLMDSENDQTLWVNAL